MSSSEIHPISHSSRDNERANEREGVGCDSDATRSDMRMDDAGSAGRLDPSKSCTQQRRFRVRQTDLGCGMDVHHEPLLGTPEVPGLPPANRSQCAEVGSVDGVGGCSSGAKGVRPRC